MLQELIGERIKMNTYGYLINTEYQPKEGEILWNFQRKEADLSIVDYIGIEGVDLGTNQNFLIIGSSEDFILWLNENGIIENDIINS